jgi:UDP-N-acetylmuramoyl-tripeptide--D-alanyl-D-alanine ligase
VHLEGSYNLPNVVAAYVVGRHFSVSEQDAQQALSSYRPTNQRSQAVNTSRNWVLLDAYNANPSSVSHAVKDFASRGHAAPLVLLGDMAELGEVSAEAHRDIAALALQHGLELWTVGDWFGQAQAASENANWTHWASFEELQQALESTPLSGRQVLVKGSRSARLERLLPSL